MMLSVIIPTRNRAPLLKKALDSLVHQTYPRDLFEIIVVDNGSTDNTKEIADMFQHSLPHLTYIFEPNPGLHEGRHAGMRNAAGEILVYADDDIVAFPTWLEGIAESFLDPAVAMVGGNNLPEYESSPPQWVEYLWRDTPYGKTCGIFSLIDFGTVGMEILPRYVYGCNFSIRKKILEEAGGFHPDGMPESLLHYRGDGETAVSEAVFLKRYKTLFNPRASVYHFVPASRMTPEYIYKRGYLQGISNSYSELRKTGGYSPSRYLTDSVRYIWTRCIDTVRMTANSRFSPLGIYRRGYLAGYRYHRKMVTKDPALLNWVLRKNYLSDPGGLK